MLEHIATDLIPSAYSLNDPLVEQDEYDDLRILIGVVENIRKRDASSNMRELIFYHSYTDREYLVIQKYNKLLYRKGYRITENTDFDGDKYIVISWGDDE